MFKLPVLLAYWVANPSPSKGGHYVPREMTTQDVVIIVAIFVVMFTVPFVMAGLALRFSERKEKQQAKQEAGRYQESPTAQ